MAGPATEGRVRLGQNGPPSVETVRVTPAETVFDKRACSDIRGATMEIGKDGVVFMRGAFDPTKAQIQGGIAKCVNGTVSWYRAPTFDIPSPIRPDQNVKVTVELTDISAGNGGSLYFAGFARVPTSTSNQEDLVVGKLSSEGDTLWLYTFGSAAAQERATKLITTPSGHVVVAGTSSGQLPQQPPEAKGNPFLAEYDEDGKQLWFAQEQNEPSVSEWRLPGTSNSISTLLAVDDANNIYALYGHSLVKTDPTGKNVWKCLLGYSVDPGDFPLNDTVSITYSLSQSALFIVGTAGPASVGADVPIFRVDAKTGEQQWVKLLSIRQMQTIDPLEGVVWHGEQTHVSDAILYSVVEIPSGLALLTSLGNWYENGSIVRATHSDALLVALNNDGTPQWVRQYRFGPLPAPDSSDTPSLYGIDIALDASNALIINATNEIQLRPTATVFRVSPLNGDVLAE
jgi:hypothetical protein